MEARNRPVADWFNAIRTGQILLPRFQRHEAWGHAQITALLESVLRGLPTGAALILEIGDEQPFLARALVGAPEPTERVTEHLLDGQQRLTALWRACHDNYPDRVYLIGEELDEEAGTSRPIVRAEPTRWKNGTRYPLWLDQPAECWARNLIPLRLCSPDAPQDEANAWVDEAANGGPTREIDQAILGYRSTVAAFNIPFLSLPTGTPRETALDVFINMNTSSVRLTSYDIVVAQYEAATGESLHDQVEELQAAVPRLNDYRSAENLLLDMAALREDRPPNQASYHRLDLAHLNDSFDELVSGAAFAIEILEGEGVFDGDRLPTVAVLPILGALVGHVPPGGDERGNAIGLLRSYLWRAFSTNRYEAAAANRALQDYRGLRGELTASARTAPIFDEQFHALPGPDELKQAQWPKNRETLARAILCASLRRGAFDLADGAKATAANMGSREYHHLFPDAYLQQNTEASRQQIYRALNCSLITWRTNRRISAKAPLVYLRERVEASSLGEDEIRRRLESHLIPWDEFAKASDADVHGSYERFLDARAEVVAGYLQELCAGREPNG